MIFRFLSGAPSKRGHADGLDIALEFLLEGLYLGGVRKALGGVVLHGPVVLQEGEPVGLAAHIVDLGFLQGHHGL